jgi:glycosyltransferase involved in cell wall biosynthesis
MTGIMKILIDARFFGLEHAGLGRYTMNLIHELARMDEKNEYVVLLRKKHMDLDLPKNWRKVKVEAKHYWFKEQAVVPYFISKYKPDVVHFLHSNVPVFYTGKFIVTIHDLTMYRQGTDATTLPLPLYYAKRIPFKLVFRKAVYESTKIIVPSHAVKNELVEFFHIPENKVTVTYEGVELRDVGGKEGLGVLGRYGLDGRKYFLYVGNVYPHKNVRKAIEAISLLNESRIANKQSVAFQAHESLIYFVIVCGRGVFRQRLEYQIKKARAGEFVKVLDFVPDQELSVLYTNSLAFVFASLSEGFGLPGLEAIQSGTLLLASDIPVFKEIYKDKAMYFDPRQVESIREAMERVLNERGAIREKKIQGAKEILKNYSWENMAKETLNVYSTKSK